MSLLALKGGGFGLELTGGLEHRVGRPGLLFRGHFAPSLGAVPEGLRADWTMLALEAIGLRLELTRRLDHRAGCRGLPKRGHFAPLLGSIAEVVRVFHAW